VTTTGPVVVPAGTVVTIVELDQLVVEANIPLKVTVLVPCDDPNCVPVMVTIAPTCPELGERELMEKVTVKTTPLLAFPPTVTTTGPVVAPAGTDVTIWVVDQLLVVAEMPLKVTVLVP
jgi:hypothetical protein